MTKYRVLAEATQLYEIYIEADNPKQAIEKANAKNMADFQLFNTIPFDDDWQIIDAEEITE